MRKLWIIGLLTVTMAVNGCNYLAVKLTPDEVKRAVAAGAAVSAVSVTDQPEGQELEDYLKANAELWEELAEFFDIKDKNEVSRLLSR